MEGMNYCGWLMEDSKHSLNRAKERTGMNRKKALKMMELAKQRGITSEDCKWSLDRNFLECRTNDTAVAIAYNGFCFIMDRDTMNCITMYQLPKHFGKKKTFYKDSYGSRQASLYEAAYS